MNAYLVSHNGLGDNLFMIGALNFLLRFYKNINFICKTKYYSNVILFFKDNPNIRVVKVNEKNIKDNIIKILKNNYRNNDILVCGCLRSRIKSKITNKAFLKHKIENKNYTINFDTINSENYSFIANFYRNIRLNLTIFYEYFSLPNSYESEELYKSVKNYRIIFIQLRSSNNKSLDIKGLLDKYLYDEKTILICNDKNLYNFNSNNPIITKKHEICSKFVFNKLIYYNDTIKNSDEIYIIDSCFTGIVLPYLKTGRLKARKVRIIRREMVSSVKLH